LISFIDLGGEEQNPFVSQDGKYLLFVSTIDGVRNIFVYDFGSSKVFRVSKVMTGAFSPKLDPSGSTLIFSSENNLSYDIYYKSFSLTNLVGSEVSNYVLFLNLQSLNFYLRNQE
jgi:Tol biopolymer transport system component